MDKKIFSLNLKKKLPTLRKIYFIYYFCQKSFFISKTGKFTDHFLAEICEKKKFSTGISSERCLVFLHISGVPTGGNMVLVPSES